MGRWSRQIATLFIDWLAPPRRARWLDVGTGTGAIVEAILGHADPGSIVALDRSEGYLAYAQAHQRDPRVAFRLGDAARLPSTADAFDVATS
ncbi:MAG TPA: class I SAM-dependent methyltransferase, partial [Kofleriaceae bacterium]|nr:class I SAM-dependent methyltransferase [Kofleriaceae bacterium]